MGERRRPGAIEDPLQCAILAHNPLLVSNVNQQSIPQQPLPAPGQSCDNLTDSFRSGAIGNRSSRNSHLRVGDLTAVGPLPHPEGVFHHKRPQWQPAGMRTILRARRQGHRAKVMLARRLREETTMSLK